MRRSPGGAQMAPATVIAVLVWVSLCFTAATGWGATPQPPAWAALPYPMTPLVQSGGGNLMPTLDTVSFRERWGPRGDARIEEQDGEVLLRLGVAGSPGSINVGAVVPTERLYEVDFEFRFSLDAVLGNSPEPGSDDRGLSGWVTPDLGDDKSVGAYEIRERRLLPEWQTHHDYVYVVGGAKRFCISLGFHGPKGCAYLRNFTLREAKVDARSGLQVIHAPEGSWGERPHQEEPSPPADLVLYHRRDPDKLFPYSAPTAKELQQGIELNCAPGEVAIAALGLFAPHEIGSVRLSLSDLKSIDGKSLDPRFEWFQIHYQPRKTDFYGRHRAFSLVADTLLSRPDGVAAPGGKTTAFWLRLTIASGARPGIYRGTLQAEVDGKELSLPVQVEVFPFALADPVDRTRGLCSDSARWAERSDDQALRELLDTRSHGIESLLLDFEKGEPTWQGEEITGWTIAYEGERTMALLARAGLRGPNLIQWWREEYDFARKLGIPGETMKQHADEWPPKLALTYRQAIKAFDAAWKKKGWGDWVYVGIDEPGYWKPGSPEFSRFEYDAAKAADVKSYCTSSDLPSDPIGRPLTYHCVGDVFVDTPETAKRFLDEGKQYGQQIWFYGSGCYSGQVGNVYSNRYVAGFLFYKSGAAGTVSWTFQRPMGSNAFDDFLQEEGQPCITIPDPEHPGENLDTPQWEGLRQAWYDYRYVATLAQEIERARHDQNRASLVPKVESDFSAILAAMLWSPQGSSQPVITNLACDGWRLRIARLVLALSPSSAQYP